MKDIIKKTIELTKINGEVLINPSYIDNEFSSMTINKIEKDERLKEMGETELSLRGQRTVFLEFHRYMYRLKDGDIIRLSNAIKHFLHNEQLNKSNNVYCDQLILKDTVDFHLHLRSARNFDINLNNEIVESYRKNQTLAKDFEEINSNLLIEFVENLTNKYSIKAKQLYNYRKILNLSQIELAKKLGISSKQISNLETGVRPVQIQTELAVECLLRQAELF